RRVYWIGRQRGGIIVVQFDQRRNQFFGRALFGSVTICLKLIAPRKPACKRRDPEGKYRDREKHQNKRQRVIRPAQLRYYAQASVEPDLLREPAEQQKENQRAAKAQYHALEDMVMNEMAKL